MSNNQETKTGFFRGLFTRRKETVAPEGQTEDAGRGEEAGPSSHAEPTPATEEPIGVPTDEGDEKGGLLRLTRGLSKTRSGFIRSLDDLFLGKKQLDGQMEGRLEEILLSADIGVRTADELLQSVTGSLKRKELSDPAAVMEQLKEQIREIVLRVESPLRIGFGPEPFVIMVVGVNGSGKTTTIAKIAARHKAAGGKVLMVAGDTFRAAAVNQMEIWAERVGCSVVKGKEKADPSAIAFEAMERALADNVDLVLVDTAGRLHTRQPLMEQLKKLRRILEKKQEGAPHETLLVIDASTGQNAILQAKTFNEAIPITGIALTKLDGTSKGGVVVGISNELKIPVRYIGIGEKMDDLRDFNAHDFVEALFAGRERVDKD